MTSEKMNHIIPMRKERSTWSLKMPCWFSPITVENQPKNIYARRIAPGTNAHAPAQSLKNDTAPAMMANSATDPRIGHGLSWGT